MAKRSRRPRRKRDDNEPKLSAEEQFQLDYAYVLKDLRRVFILAGFMFTLLIVLNLVLG